MVQWYGVNEREANRLVASYGITLHGESQLSLFIPFNNKQVQFTPGFGGLVPCLVPETYFSYEPVYTVGDLGLPSQGTNVRSWWVSRSTCHGPKTVNTVAKWGNMATDKRETFKSSQASPAGNSGPSGLRVSFMTNASSSGRIIHALSGLNKSIPWALQTSFRRLQRYSDAPKPPTSTTAFSPVNTTRLVWRLPIVTYRDIPA